jgi:hypothetical protein
VRNAQHAARSTQRNAKSVSKKIEGGKWQEKSFLPLGFFGKKQKVF